MNKYGRMRQDNKETPRFVQVLGRDAGSIKYNKNIYGADVLVKLIGEKVIVKPFGLKENQLEVNKPSGEFVCIAMRIVKNG